ncbi:hypothetical protein [Aquimarina hainanensis]|uniref:hypothetical protein n=1 Tax=Aquimarina hainanensis TaxID=1578017 RepID=UPI00360E6077
MIELQQGTLLFSIRLSKKTIHRTIKPTERNTIVFRRKKKKFILVNIDYSP